ncbi:11898_t:CDS:2 [Funneliformis geosporum]|uniref:11898_t:CDS:1 n=1 Tax=Funneliformis geosporum TaxID=1117311 RepID=A0A9W4SYL2_9GLOM|nr:11898_t:CDS:2 [Funneliformis geosporum]
MLVRYNTRAAREFFPYSFRPTQAKLHIWPSLIHNRCTPQARHTHTYSDAKDALNTGVRNAKESIKKGVKKDLSVWKIINGLIVIGTGIVVDLSFAHWYNRRNERILFNAFEHGSCPEPDVPREMMIYREDVIKKLRRIFEPKSTHSSYHVVVGNHGTGKTTMVRECAKEVGKGVIYVDVPPVLNKFVENFANAIGFHEHCSFIELFRQKFLEISNSDAFKRGAKNYKANNDGKPLMLILDNISKLSQKNVKMIEDLQDLTNSMLTSPVASLCLDLTDEEILIYLCKLNIEEKDANQLIELLGDWIKDLKIYGYWIKEGMTLKDKKIHKIVFYSIENDFHQAQIMKSEVNHAISNVIVDELVKNEKIEYDEFIKLVNNKEIADKLIQANVFSYNLENNFVTFQSRTKEIFVKENLRGVFSYSKQ